jgi:hypothetical protein
MKEAKPHSIYRIVYGETTDGLKEPSVENQACGKRPHKTCQSTPK